MPLASRQRHTRHQGVAFSPRARIGLSRPLLRIRFSSVGRSHAARFRFNLSEPLRLFMLPLSRNSCTP